MLISRGGASLVVAAIVLGQSLGCTANARPVKGNSVEPSPLWTVAGEGRGVPTFDGSTVYMLSQRHELLAIEAASGRVQWRASTGQSGGATLGSSVVAVDHHVVAGDYDVVAFHAGSGAPAWRFAPDAGIAPGVYLGAAAAGHVFTGSSSGHLYAIHAIRGTLAWVAALTQREQTTVFAPVVVGRLVLAGFTVFGAPAGGGVVAVDRDSGTEIWRTSFPVSDGTGSSGFAGGPIVLNGEVMAASADGTIFAMSLVDGRIRRSLPMEPGDHTDGERPEFRALAFEGGTFIAGSLRGAVTAYHEEHQDAAWRFTSARDGSVAFNVFIDRGVAYVPFLSGRLVAIDVATGEERWRLGSADMPFRWPPAVAGDRIFFSSPAGYFAFQA